MSSDPRICCIYHLSMSRVGNANAEPPLRFPRSLEGAGHLLPWSAAALLECPHRIHVQQAQWLFDGPQRCNILGTWNFRMISYPGKLIDSIPQKLRISLLVKHRLDKSCFMSTRERSRHCLRKYCSHKASNAKTSGSVFEILVDCDLETISAINYSPI